MLKCSLWSLPVFLVLACETAPPAGQRSPAETAPRATGGTADGVGKYGAPLGKSSEEKLASVLADPARFAGKPVLVEGHVRRACSKMGCWMELADGADANAQACRVIMKDHKFFVPKDAAGSKARVEGVLEARRIEPEQVTHMEQEGAVFSLKAADGSAQELRFVASGVELRRGT